MGEKKNRQKKNLSCEKRFYINRESMSLFQGLCLDHSRGHSELAMTTFSTLLFFYVSSKTTGLNCDSEKTQQKCIDKCL